MIRTVEAVIDEKGSVVLLEKVALSQPCRAVVTILESSGMTEKEASLLMQKSQGDGMDKPASDEKLNDTVQANTGNAMPDSLPWQWNAVVTPAPIKVRSKRLLDIKRTQQYKVLFMSLGIAAGAGVAIAVGVLLFLNSFNRYSNTAQVQQVAALMMQGEKAYNTQDYATAAQDYQQALAANPTVEQRNLLSTNLAYTYVQLGRAARISGKLAEARDDFAKALQYQPDYQTAHTELAVINQNVGNGIGVQGSNSANTVTVSVEPPPNLNTRPTNGFSNTSVPNPNQFLNQRRQEAQRLIQDGDDLFKHGDRDGARAKWGDALQKGAGFPEFDTANQRLHDSEPPSMFGSDQ